jgi:hypothetical protein
MDSIISTVAYSKEGVLRRLAGTRPPQYICSQSSSFCIKLSIKLGIKLLHKAGG